MEPRSRYLSANSCRRNSSSSKRHHRRGLKSRSTWATANHGPFNKRDPGHEFSIVSRLIGPALPRLPDLVGSGKALKADPWKRRSVAKRTAFGVGSILKRHLDTCERRSPSLQLYKRGSCQIAVRAQLWERVSILWLLQQRVQPHPEMNMITNNGNTTQLR